MCVCAYQLWGYICVALERLLRNIGLKDETLDMHIIITLTAGVRWSSAGMKKPTGS